MSATAYSACDCEFLGARRFAALLAAEQPLVLPSAWDAGSARLLERAGAKAIAVHLDDVAWSLGHETWTSAPDDLTAACSRICRAAAGVPITVDLGAIVSTSRFASYSATPLVRVLLASGVAALTVSADATLDAQMQSIRALRSLRARDGSQFFIEARVSRRTLGARGGSYDVMLGLARACVAAGADGVLVSGSGAADVVRLAREISTPVSVDVGDGWAPPVRLFARAGVRCVRLGRGVLRASLGVIQTVVREALDRGSYDLMSRHMADSDHH
jgi:2-methylisocitrate lyase-like PEP mutase family enzyme